MVYFYPHRRIYVGAVAEAMLCSAPACSNSWGRVGCFSLRFSWRRQSCPVSAMLSLLVVTVEFKDISCCSTISGLFFRLAWPVFGPPLACLWSEYDDFLARRSCTIEITLPLLCVPSHLKWEFDVQQYSGRCDAHR